MNSHRKGLLDHNPRTQTIAFDLEGRDILIKFLFEILVAPMTMLKRLTAWPAVLRSHDFRK